MSSVQPDSKVRHLEFLNETFERIGAWSYDHRVVVLLVCLGLLAASGWFAGKTRFDNSVEGFFDTEDSTYTSYVDYREEFGSDEISYIVYTVPDSPMARSISRRCGRSATSRDGSKRRFHSSPRSPA